MASEPANADDTPAPFALGPGLGAAAFVPGRFAAVIHRQLDGIHALQRVHEDSSASFVLELHGGQARVCRGWRYQMTNDGPDVHSDDRFREQAGFRGTYVERAGVIIVSLQRDDGGCAPIAEFMYPPARATTIGLECVMAAPDGHPVLTTPVLVCRWTSTPSSERDAHTVAGLGPADAIVLGPGPGLAVTIVDTPPAMAAVGPSSLTAAPASEPLADDAWQR